MQCIAHKLKNRHFGEQWQKEVLDQWDYADMLKHKHWKEHWISFDCLCYFDKNDTVYAGITSFNADIFKGFNRRTMQFESTGFEQIANQYDAKFHRSLERDGDDLYGAIALLHDVDRFWEAPGGAIVKFNPAKNEIHKIGIPIEHVYIQSIVLDSHRGIIYGQTFTPERFFRFDLETCKSVDMGPIGSGMEMGQGETLCLDDDGNVWGSWNISRAWQSSPGADSFRLFCYRRGTKRIEFLEQGIPNGDGSRGFCKLESIFNFGTGCLYASGGNGSLYRIDTKKKRAEYLFTAIDNRRSRLAAMCMARDGFAYGITGRDGRCELLRFDLRTEEYELLGEIKTSDGINCWQIHHIISLPDGTLFAGENDVPIRSGYLWEIKL